MFFIIEKSLLPPIKHQLKYQISILSFPLLIPHTKKIIQKYSDLSALFVLLFILPSNYLQCIMNQVFLKFSHSRYNMNVYQHIDYENQQFPSLVLLRLLQIIYTFSHRNTVLISSAVHLPAQLQYRSSYLTYSYLLPRTLLLSILYFMYSNM